MATVTAIHVRKLLQASSATITSNRRNLDSESFILSSIATFIFSEGRLHPSFSMHYYALSISHFGGTRGKHVNCIFNPELAELYADALVSATVRSDARIQMHTRCRNIAQGLSALSARRAASAFLRKNLPVARGRLHRQFLGI